MTGFNFQQLELIFGYKIILYPTAARKNCALSALSKLKSFSQRQKAIDQNSTKEDNLFHFVQVHFFHSLSWKAHCRTLQLNLTFSTGALLLGCLFDDLEHLR